MSCDSRAAATAMVFSGQGGEWLGMGRGLYHRFPLYAVMFDEACSAVRTAVSRLGLPAVDVRGAVFGADPVPLQRTGIAQPAVFALQVALFRLLESWGVEPDVVAGHSLGEFAAMYAAGGLSLPDAALLVTARAALMQALPPGGAMLRVAASEEDIEEDLSPRVDVAAIDGPASVVVSGAAADISSLAARWRSRGIGTIPLPFDRAFHSWLMRPIMPALREVASRVTVREPAIPFVSTVTERRATLDQLRSPGYWAYQARHTVRFDATVRTIAALHPKPMLFLEIGPDEDLAPAIAGTQQDAVCVSLLRRGQRDDTRLLTALTTTK